MNTRKIPVVEKDIADGGCVSRHEIDHSRRQPCRFEQFHDVIVAEDRRARGFPDNGIAHLRRRRREIGPDRCEIERRNGINEAFQGPVIHAIPHERRTHRLVIVNLLGEVSIESQEIDRLANRIDFGLMDGLALIEHRRGVDRVAPRCRHEIGCTEKNRSAIFQAPRRPLASGLCSGLDRLFHFLRACFMPGRQDVAMSMRHHLRSRVAGPHFLAANQQRNLDFFGRHLGQPAFQSLPVAAARLVVSDGIVDRDGNSITAHDSAS